MSIYQLFRDAIPRLARTRWGSSITDREGVERDSGVNELAEELVAILSSQAPIPLDEPIRVIKNYTGTTFEVVTEPNVEAANDPLSVNAFGGVRLTLEDVRTLAELALQTANNAIDAAVQAITAANRQKVFPGIITAVGTHTAFQKLPYRVQIDLDGTLTQVYAWAYTSGSRTWTLNTRVLLIEVGSDKIVTSYLNGQNFRSNPGVPSYYFVEPYSLA